MQIFTECNLAPLVAELLNGKTVVFPTETSYGLGCDATNQAAVDKIFKIKGRRAEKPLLVVVPSVAMAKKYLVWNELLEKIARQYWPGAVTVVGEYRHPSSAEEGSASRPGEILFGEPRWISAEHVAGEVRTIALRREMRKNPSKAEKTLWNCLRGKKLGGLKFLRQHGIGPYIVDFYQANSKTIIEIDGDIHFAIISQGIKDRRREQWLQERGYRILRYNNIDVFNNLRWILEEICAAVILSHPALPSAEGRGAVLLSFARGIVSHDNTVAVRVTAYPLLKSITKKLGRPLVATSANLADAGEVYDSKKIIAIFKDREFQPEIVLDYGVLPPHPPTTVVSVAGGELKVLRQGEAVVRGL